MLGTFFIMEECWIEGYCKVENCKMETLFGMIGHESKAAWAIDSDQETFLRENGKGKIKVLSKEETEEIF